MSELVSYDHVDVLLCYTYKFCLMKEPADISYMFCLTKEPTGEILLRYNRFRPVDIVSVRSLVGIWRTRYTLSVVATGGVYKGQGQSRSELSDSPLLDLSILCKHSNE